MPGYLSQKIRELLLLLILNVFLNFRLTIAYFSVSGLDVLGAISTVSLDLRSKIINWVYRLQVQPSEGEKLRTSQIQLIRVMKVLLGIKVLNREIPLT